MTIRLRLIDLDDSLTQQSFLRSSMAPGAAQHVAARDLGASLRLWSGATAYTAMRRRLQQSAPAPGGGATVSLLGSGDHHHLTPLRLEAEQQPLSRIRFDNHPVLQPLAECLP